MAIIQNEIHINPLDLNPDIAIGIKLPFIQTSGRLFDLSYTTEDQAHSNLRSLLLTIKGERIMQPTFGTAIYKLLFDPISGDTVDKLHASLSRDIAFWLPYILINSLNIKWASESDDENTIYISLKYSVDSNEDSETEIILFANLDGVRIL